MDDIAKLRSIIESNAPSLTLTDVHGIEGMYGYGPVKYQTNSMKAPGEWPLVALKRQKNYISVYVCVITDGEYMSERYASRLGKVSCGKSCIRFKKLDDLDKMTFKVMLQEIDNRYSNGEKLFGQ